MRKLLYSPVFLILFFIACSPDDETPEDTSDDPIVDDSTDPTEPDSMIYDPEVRLTSYSNGQGGNFTFRYNESTGNVSSIILTNGQATLTMYYSNNRLDRINEDCPNCTNGTINYYFSYDSEGRVSGVEKRTVSSIGTNKITAFGFGYYSGDYEGGDYDVGFDTRNDYNPNYSYPFNYRVYENHTLSYFDRRASSSATEYMNALFYYYDDVSKPNPTFHLLGDREIARVLAGYFGPAWKPTFFGFFGFGQYNITRVDGYDRYGGDLIGYNILTYDYNEYKFPTSCLIKGYNENDELVSQTEATYTYGIPDYD